MATNLTNVTNAGLAMPDANKGIVTTSSSTSLDKDAFLKLLAAQSRSQDPMNPTDNTAQIAQLAQFSALEQMSHVAEETKALRVSGEGDRAIALVGHAVTYQPTNGPKISGTVDKVNLTADGPLLTIDGVEGIATSSLVEVR